MIATNYFTSRQGEIDKVIKTLSTELQRRIVYKSHPEKVTSLQFLNAKTLLIGHDSGDLILLNPSNFYELWSFPQAHHGAVVQILLLSSEDDFITVGSDSRILYWNEFEIVHEYDWISPITSIYWDNTFFWISDQTNFVSSLEFTAEGFEDRKQFTIITRWPKFPQICVYLGKKALLFYGENSINLRNIQENVEILHFKTAEITALVFVPDLNLIVYAEQGEMIKTVSCANKEVKNLKFSVGTWNVLQEFEQKVLIAAGTGVLKEGCCCKFWNLEDGNNIVIIQFNATPMLMSQSHVSEYFFMYMDGQCLVRVQKHEQNTEKTLNVDESILDFFVRENEVIVAYGNFLKIISNEQESLIDLGGKINFITLKNNKLAWETEGKISYLDLTCPEKFIDVISPRHTISLLTYGFSDNVLIFVEYKPPYSKIIAFDLLANFEILTVQLEDKKVTQVVNVGSVFIYSTDDGVTFHNAKTAESSFLPTFAKTNLKLCLSSDTKRLFCAGDNEIIDIISITWSSNKDQALKKNLSSSFSTESSKKKMSPLRILYKAILSIALDHSEQHLVVGKEDGIQYWNIKDELLIWKNKIKAKKGLKIRTNSRNMFFSQENQIAVYSDPASPTGVVSRPGMINKFLGLTETLHEKIFLLGPNSSSLYFLGAVNGIANKWIRTNYDKRIYQWVAFPNCINFLHFCVHLQNSALISKAFEAGCPFIRTTSGKSPLTIALELKNKEVIELVLVNVAKIAEKHPKILGSIEADLPSVNKAAPPSLSRIYYMAFPIVSQKGLKSYGNLIDKKGVIITNQSYLIDENDFLQAKGYDTLEEISVVYRASAFRMNFREGSLDSLRFLDSLINCPDNEVFRTHLVKAIVLYKWRQIKLYVLILDCFFIVSSLYTLYYVGFSVSFTWIGNIFIFIVNTFFLIQEVLQICVGKKSYLKSVWNLIDISRIIFCYTFLYLKFLYFSEIILPDTPVSSDGLFPFKTLPDKRIYQSFVIVLVLLTLLRGLSLFELFDRTRSMIKVFTDVIKDSIVFLIVLATTTLAFTFLFMILDKNLSFFDAFTSTYSINFGTFNISLYSNSDDPTKSSYTLLACFHLATLINPLLMVNLLVSIMNDTFARLKNNLETEDLKALAELLTEHESILMWRKREDVKEFIQICSQESSDEVTSEKRMRKIAQLREKVTTIKTEVERMDEKVKESFEFYGKKIAECRKQETEFLERICKEEASLKLFINRSNTLN